MSAALRVSALAKHYGELQALREVSFELRAVESVGEGLMRWAPDGRNIVARWDFVVEND